MASESKHSKHKVNSELFQLLLCVVVIGVFLLVETWLIFYYDGGFVFPLIFGVLTILMLCLLALNMYQIFVKRFLISGGSSDKKAEFLIYKQVKSLPDTFDKQLKTELASISEEIVKNQKLTAKAILLKVDEQLKAQGNDSDISAQFESMNAEIAQLKEQIEQLKSQNENLTNQMKIALVDHEAIKDNFPELNNEHKKVFDLLGSISFRNDEIKQLLQNIEQLEESAAVNVASANNIETTEDSKTVERMTDIPDTSQTTEPEHIGIADIDNFDINGVDDGNSDEENVADISIDDVAAEPEITDSTEEAVSKAETTDINEESIAGPDITDSTEEAAAENQEESVAGIDLSAMGDDPNRQLTPDEIAAMFANM